jgi:exopolyphosphatase/guanosine-5'-triphosphate,3'-diphosphate pyrophosphatase
MVPAGLSHLVGTGKDLAIIGELCEAKQRGDFRIIPKDRFEKLYDSMKTKSTWQLTAKYGVPPEKCDTLLPAMAIFGTLLNSTAAGEVLVPSFTTADCLLFETLCPEEFARIEREFYTNTVESARLFAAHYQAQSAHSDNVSKYALQIFDKTQRIHGLGQRERLLLQTAAILHDTGRFISPRKHYDHSYTLVGASEIVGLKLSEREIVACVCMFHSVKTPNESDEHYKKLSADTRVVVSKLAAMLRLADALDPSLEKKFTDIDVRLTEELSVYVKTDKNIDLEKWTFKNKAEFFEEVFGIKAKLRQRRTV